MYTEYNPIELYKRQQTRLIKRTLCNTYALLALHMFFGAFMAAVAALTALPSLGLYLTLSGYIALLFLAYMTQDSEWSLISIFVLSGLMGLTLGPMFSVYFEGAQAIVFKVLMSTGIVLAALSLVILLGKRLFSLLHSILFVILLVACLFGMSAYLFEMPALALKIVAASALITSAVFVYAASSIVRAGQYDYVAATVCMFVAMFNLVGERKPSTQTETP